MKKLWKDKKGFTLMEMLIVVAIIVILVAISIPTFTSQLNKAKDATDQANLRSAKANAIAAQLVESTDFSTTQYYDITTGKITDTKPTTGQNENKTGGEKIIQITEDSTTGELKVEWAPLTSGS